MFKLKCDVVTPTAATIAPRKTTQDTCDVTGSDVHTKIANTLPTHMLALWAVQARYLGCYDTGDVLVTCLKPLPTQYGTLANQAS